MGGEAMKRSRAENPVDRSSDVTIITGEQPSHGAAALDLACNLGMEGSVQYGIIDAASLVRSLVVVMPKPSPEDAVHLGKGKEDEVVQAFTAAVGQVRFDVGVHVRGEEGGSDSFQADGFHGLIEDLPELSVVVANQIPSLNAFVLTPHIDVPKLLSKPDVVGIERGRGHVNPTGFEVDDDENESVHPTPPSEHPDGNEVASQ